MAQVAGRCQIEKPDEFAGKRWPDFLFNSNGRIRKVYRLRVLLGKVWGRLRSEGPLATLKRAVVVLVRKSAARLRETPAAAVEAPVRDKNVLVLNLQPGEWVEVKSFAEIRQTLDGEGKCQGLEFTPEMMDYCGKRQRVLKRVEVLFNEYTREHRKMKNTVLLEGVHCLGTGFGCDRHCYHFWREAWLRRVHGSSGADHA